MIEVGILREISHRITKAVRWRYHLGLVYWFTMKRQACRSGALALNEDKHSCQQGYHGKVSLLLVAIDQQRCYQEVVDEEQ